MLLAGKAVRYDFWRDKGLGHEETVARVEAEFVPDSADAWLVKDTSITSRIESFATKTPQQVEAEIGRYHAALIRAGGTPKEVISFLTAHVGAAREDSDSESPREARVLKWAAVAALSGS